MLFVMRSNPIIGLRPVFTLLLVFIGMAGCKQHSGCTEFGAENYDPDAVLNDGSCIAVSDKFIGNFSVSSDCFQDDYNRQITATSDDHLVIISNLADTLGNVQAQVAGVNITIDVQTVGTFITVEGAGVYVKDNDAISMSYRVRDTRTGTEIIHDCIEWCSKQ